MKIQGRHLKGAGVGWRGLRAPRTYDFNFFPANRTFETVLLLQKQYDAQTATPKSCRDH